MKKIYIFYLYGTKDNINEENYPGIYGLEGFTSNNLYHVMYAWTHNKDIRKLFKQQRDMEIFHEVIHEISKDEFNKFSDDYSDTFLEQRAITTKCLDADKIFRQKTIYILTTKHELDYMVENAQNIARNQLSDLVSANIYIHEDFFNDVYSNILTFFKFDEMLAYTYPIDDNDIPFKVIDDDNLAIYTHLYHNTYRKELNQLI